MTDRLIWADFSIAAVFVFHIVKYVSENLQNQIHHFPVSICPHLIIYGIHFQSYQLYQQECSTDDVRAKSGLCLDSVFFSQIEKIAAGLWTDKMHQGSPHILSHRKTNIFYPAHKNSNVPVNDREYGQPLISCCLSPDNPHHVKPAAVSL